MKSSRELEISGLEEKIKTNGTFEIHARRMFLTYSQVPDVWTKMYVKRRLVNELLVKRYGKEKNKTRVKAYIIAEEKHENGGRHFHCLLELESKYRMKGVEALDIDDLHGNYQVVKNIWKAINYVKKGKNYISEGFLGVGSEVESLLNANIEDARLMVMEEAGPALKLQLKDQIGALRYKRKVVEETVERVPMFEFHKCLMPFNRGAGIIPEGRPKGLILYGEPESGKTTLAYRMARDLGEDIIIVRKIKEMPQHYGGETIILFDEVSKVMFEEEEMQRLLGDLVTNPAAKTVEYYGVKECKWPRKVILATNEDVEDWKFSENLQSRFILAKVFKDNKYQFKEFKEGKIVNLEEGEIARRIKRE